MPELNPYNQQVETQGAVGAVTPNLEAVSAVGRGFERLGSDVSDLGQTFYNKNKNTEMTNGFAAIQDMREQETDNLQEALRTGQLDTEQYKQQLQDKMDQATSQQDFSTVEGRNYFERQKARLQGYLLTKAGHISSQIEANNTVDGLTDIGNSMSNTALKDPAQFPDLMDQLQETAQAYTDGGSLPSSMKDKFIREMGAKIADGAAKGLAQMDPGKDASGKPNPNFLTQMLSHPDQPFQQYLNADRITELENYAKVQDKGRVADDLRTARLEKDNKEKAAEAWETSNLPLLENHTLSAKAVIDARDTLGFNKAEHLLQTIREQSRQPTPDNEANYIRMQQGITAEEGAPNKVYSTDQIWKMAAQKQLSVKDANALTTEFNKSKYAQDMKSEKQNFYKAAEEAVRYRDITSPLVPQPYAPGGNTSYAALLRESHQMEANVPQGQNPRALYDPNNKDGIYSLIDKYRATPQKVQKDTAELMKANAIKKAVLPPGVRHMKLGESISDWKKATGQ